VTAPERSIELHVVGAGASAGLAGAARHLLGAREAEAQRFAALQDRTLVLFRPSKAEREALVRRLETCGATVEVRPAKRDGHPCERHPRLAALDVCPGCERRRACAACLSWSPARACDACRRRRRRGRIFRAARIGLLLAVLGAVAFAQWRAQRRFASWTEPVRVAVFAGAADPSVERFAKSLSPADFAPIGRFIGQEAMRHGLGFRPSITFRIGPRLRELPPPTPDDAGVWDAVRFSLALRWWAMTAIDTDSVGKHDARIALVLHPPRDGASLQHSVGLARGQVGVVHAFADRDLLGLLRVVTAHELFHLAGATDKYRPDGRPAFPEGYANPSGGPGPRPVVEIMAGTRIDEHGATQLPESLEDCAVGPATARELQWRRTESP